MGIPADFLLLLYVKIGAGTGAKIALRYGSDFATFSTY
jgi:hypothetical protein